MADMEDLFGSDADSDAEHKGGIDWASAERVAEGLLRPEPDRGQVPGLRTLGRCGLVVLPPFLPQRPLHSRRCQPPPAGGSRGTNVEREPGDSWCRWSMQCLGACRVKGARGRGGGAGEPAQPRTEPWGPALSWLAQASA